MKEERDVIAVLYERGESISAIARVLKRDKGTVSREVRRNRSAVYNVYLPHKAQQRAETRNIESHRRQRLKNGIIRKYVVAKLKIGWSPEQIAGRIPNRYHDYGISHEAIYQFVYDKHERKENDLVPYLAWSHRKRWKRGHSHKHRKTHIPDRISINSRPDYINKRKQLGHWEADTVVSRQSSAALCVLTERMTRLTKISLLTRKGAHELRVAINRRLCHYPKHVKRTLTYDNGSENVEHSFINHVLGTKSYFCNPYHSWEKGTVENTIGIIRRYLPKKTDFATISPLHVRTIERRMNNRPRKCLNFKTPIENFQHSVALTG